QNRWNPPEDRLPYLQHSLSCMTRRAGGQNHRGLSVLPREIDSKRLSKKMAYPVYYTDSVLKKQRSALNNFSHNVQKFLRLCLYRRNMQKAPVPSTGTRASNALIYVRLFCPSSTR